MFRTIDGPQGGKVNLDGRTVINLASNNYLGLANHPALVEAAKHSIDKYGVGACAGRTIVGNYDIHNKLEKKLAEFKDVEATLVFNSGLSVNMGVIPVLAGKGDDIFSDELNHASIIDGCRLSGANIRVYKHIDMSSLENRLKESKAGNKLIITDGVFSMDGDLAPLTEIAELAKKYKARLMVDDAHGDGVMGPFGKGTAAHFGVRGRVDVETGSLSKAFGSGGGFVAGSSKLIELVKHMARSFIFTSSPLQASMASATYKAIELLSTDDSLVKKLWVNREYFVSKMARLGFGLGNTRTPIIPIMIGGEADAKNMMQELLDNGIFAQSIQYPIVASSKARLRVIISADHTREDLDVAIAGFEKAGKKLSII